MRLLPFVVAIAFALPSFAAVDLEQKPNPHDRFFERLPELRLVRGATPKTMPLIVTLTVEKGFLSAMSEIAWMFLSGGPLYFIFHIQTKCYYFQQI